VKDGEFLNQLSDCLLLKVECSLQLVFSCNQSSTRFSPLAFITTFVSAKAATDDFCSPDMQETTVHGFISLGDRSLLHEYCQIFFT
jgi:hypothetical protein